MDPNDKKNEETAQGADTQPAENQANTSEGTAQETAAETTEEDNGE